MGYIIGKKRRWNVFLLFFFSLLLLFCLKMVGISPLFYAMIQPAPIANIKPNPAIILPWLRFLIAAPVLLSLFTRSEVYLLLEILHSLAGLTCLALFAKKKGSKQASNDFDDALLSFTLLHIIIFLVSYTPSRPCYCSDILKAPSPPEPRIASQHRISSKSLTHTANSTVPIYRLA